MKKAFFLIISILSFQALSSVEINCKVNSKMAEAELTMNLSEINNNLFLTVTGAKEPMFEFVTEIVQEDMKNIKTLLACGEIEDEQAQEICAYQYAVRNNALDSRVFVDVQMMQIYEKEGMGSFSFDKSKIASGTRYNVGEASKFGQVGVTIFSDKDGNTIGKLLNMIEVMDCK
jgi:hypothetical protein